MKDNFCCVMQVMSRIDMSWTASVRSDDTVKEEEQFFFKLHSEIDRKYEPNLGALRQAAEIPISQEIIKNTNDSMACYLQHYSPFPSEYTLTNLS